MRNILVFPDGTEQHFMYPENREVEVGERLQLQQENDVVRVLQITEIVKKENNIYYHLAFSE